MKKRFTEEQIDCSILWLQTIICHLGYTSTRHVSYNFDDLLKIRNDETPVKYPPLLALAERLILTMSNQDKISGPLLDRIDMQFQVDVLPQEELMQQANGESSAEVAQRVARAFTVQQQRQRKSNNLLSTKEIDLYCQPNTKGEQLLKQAMARLNWSARSYHRVLMVARTIADLVGASQVEHDHVAEAIQYRRVLREH